MDTFAELDDRKKIVALLRVLLARCTEQAVTPYLTAYRRKLQTLVNRQSKRVIQECIVEAVHSMTTPKPGTLGSKFRGVNVIFCCNDIDQA